MKRTRACPLRRHSGQGPVRFVGTGHGMAGKGTGERPLEPAPRRDHRPRFTHRESSGQASGQVGTRHGTVDKGTGERPSEPAPAPVPSSRPARAARAGGPAALGRRGGCAATIPGRRGGCVPVAEAVCQCHYTTATAPRLRQRLCCLRLGAALRGKTPWETAPRGRGGGGGLNPKHLTRVSW